ncbi:O-antigen ligase family protein [Aeromonas caviae]|uniref:O-antigen ligase family protein n=1 Tax=Aeromonas caviae TaxID=648 RepID=UPI0024C8552B|nr:O-antigen ligase family protein [Aeromonas caviae]WAF65558.1 O-antigen ligase family protein [Aeromonas caviae]WAF82384.1 O-antigen ligase family protein [Aeromonas caviae]
MKLTKIKSCLLSGLCFTSILANTALMNIGGVDQGGFGIPLFWVFSILLFPFIINDFKYQFWLCLACFTFIFLIAVISNIDYAYSYLTQYVSRIFLFLIFLCFIFFKDINFPRLLIKIHYFLIFIVLLSVTAFILLIFLNFDLGLYNIANSYSFGFRGGQLNEVNGWANQIRLTGVWSEPSYLTIPLMMLIYLNNNHHTKFYWLVLILSISMIIFSFSRSIWISIAILIVFSSFKYSKTLTKIFFKWRLTAVVMIFFVGSLSFIFYGNLAGNDSSTTGRVGSAVVGGEMIKAHPLLGMGPGTFSKLKNEPEFSVSNVDISDENVIHSAFISIWQQFGIVGWVFFFLPYYVLLKNINYNHFHKTFPYIFSLPVVLVVSGDFTYFSYYWLFLGVLFVQHDFGGNK